MAPEETVVETEDVVLPAPATLTYEQAKGELRQVVQSLESGSIPLEDTLRLWKRGESLAARCKWILDQAAMQLESAEAAGLSETQ